MATNVIKTATNSDIEALKKRQKRMAILLKTVTYVFLAIMAVVVIFPFYWMIISSLKSYEEYHLVDQFAGQTIPTFFPTKIMWENYYIALFGGKYMTMEEIEVGLAALDGSPYQHMLLLQSMVTTLGIGVASTFLSVGITIIAAFAFGRLQFKGRELMFTILLMTMMIPGELFTITNYETVTKLHWTYMSSNGETWKIYLSYVIPFLVSVFYIYLLRNNFKQIPNELYYAAKVDGASDIKYLFKVMVPLAMPSIISITILKMMGAWNSYIWPNLVSTGLQDGTYMLVSVILRKNYNGAVEGMYPFVHLRMAACVIVSVPLFIVFALFRKYIIRGVSKSGIKG